MTLRYFQTARLCQTRFSYGTIEGFLRGKIVPSAVRLCPNCNWSRDLKKKESMETKMEGTDYELRSLRQSRGRELQNACNTIAMFDSSISESGLGTLKYWLLSQDVLRS